MEVLGGCLPALWVCRLSQQSCLSFAGAGVGRRMVFLGHLSYLSHCCHTILDKSHSRKEGRVSSAHSRRAHSPARWGRNGGQSVRQWSQGSHSRKAEKDKEIRSMLVPIFLSSSFSFTFVFSPRSRLVGWCWLHSG